MAVIVICFMLMSRVPVLAMSNISLLLPDALYVASSALNVA